MHDLEVRELRYFVAVAEERNFSRAAGRLGIAQPPLSRAIAQLEARLGVRLFERSPRRVELTVAGETLLQEAEGALAGMAAAAHRTRRAALRSPVLVVTAKPGVATGLLRRIVDRYAATPGSVPVEIAVSGYREQADMVRDGRADCALLSSPFDAHGLDREPLFTGPRVAALPADHPLAARDALSCSDLDGEPFPRWPETTPDEALYWEGRDHGEGPGRGRAPGSTEAKRRAPGPLVADGAQMLEAIALGQAVGLIPAFLAERSPRADVAYRPVLDASPYTIAIAWPERAKARHLAVFVRVATEVAAAEAGDLAAAAAQAD